MTRRKEKSTSKKGAKPLVKKSKEKDPKQPKQIPKTLESKRIFDADQVMNADTLEDMDKNDEFSGFFINGQQPKILITTTCRPGLKAQEFAKELSDFFPNAEYKQRTLNTPVPDVVKGATIRNYTHLVLVNESRKQFETLSIVKLPEGPTAIFQLTSVKLGKQIHNHGRSTSHTPELILNNFITKLGHRIGRMFVSMFPHVPEFQGRQAVTFHNQRDFIFIRRHRYIFENGERVRMQEIGPQFTIKLKKVVKATFNLQDADVEYEWKAHAIDKRKFAL